VNKLTMILLMVVSVFLPDPALKVRYVALKKRH
jgi:hypothetical protein